MGYRDYRDYVEFVVLPKKCRQMGVDEDKVRMIFAKLEPISIKVETENSFMQLELHRQLQDFVQWYFPNVRTWSKVVAKTTPVMQTDVYNIDVLFMITYMTIAESAYKFVVDWLCCALAATDTTHEFAKNAKNCKCISGKTLGKKRSYLKDRKLGQIADAFDPHIRNAAAHMSFKVRQDGVHIRKLDRNGIPMPETESVVNIGKEYTKLRSSTLEWYQAIVHYYDIHHGGYKHFSNFAFTTEESIAMVESTVAHMEGTQQDQWSNVARSAEDEFRSTGRFQ